MADINDVIDKLLDRTQQDKINWRSSIAANTFIATIGNMGVSISLPRQTMVESIVSFRIFDEKGQAIQELSVDGINNPHLHNKLTKIHSKARQIASGDDPRLDELLTELEKA